METKSITDLRIGVPIIGAQGWLGGITYVELLIKALGLLSEQERPKIFLVVPESKLGALDLHSHIFSMLDGFIFLGNNYRLASSLIQHPFIHCRSYSELADHIDFYYPVNSDVVPELCSGSWIPDFQHVHLPDFFPKEELVRRDGWFRKVAEKARLAVFSSKDSEDDFRRLYPDSPAATRVLHFYALPVDDWYQADPAEVQSKYNLPDNFLICCNQFWVHKNHARLFEALAIVRRTAPDVHLVCTGAVSEWRIRDYFPRLLELMEDLGIKDRLHILGTIPRNDQIQLIRRSLAVIQPSLFEGWSTVIEDSRALGKSMVLSDLKVHYEQAPDHAVYFDRNSPDDLAEKIIALLPELKPGPDASREREARAKANDSVLTYAREFCDIALDAQRLFKKGITVATSIAPKKIEQQKAAIASWLKLGFKVISVNTSAEINSLKDHFADVTFFEASRNAVGITGKPYIFLDDVLRALDACQSEICGIINSDIHLIAGGSFHDFIRSEAKGSFLYGTRIEIESLNSLKGEEYMWGYDYFFFDKSVIPLYPSSNFSIGAPWWDLWACFIPAVKNFRLKKMEGPVAYHITHPKNWSKEVWTIFLKEFLFRIFNDDSITSSLFSDFKEEVKSYIQLRRFAEFSQYVVLFVNQKAGKITAGASQVHETLHSPAAHQKAGIQLPSSGKKITIATSIAPKNIGRQQEAVQSWLKLGFDVSSLNCPEEVSELRDQFPEVTFVEVDRDARAEIGKPMVYFDSFREFFRRSDSRICGIVNSDVLLEAADGLMSFIEREAENCMVTGCRVDVQEPQSREGTLYLHGFDYFFFDRSVLELYPEDKFTLGSPWWDYWILLIPITKGVRVKNIVPPIGYHVRHTVNWKHEIWKAFGERIAVYIRDQNTGIAPDPDLDPSLKYNGISHAVETHILQNSEYIAFKPAASRLLDFFLLDKIDLSSQIAAVRGPLSKFKLRTFEIYLKKCFELFPGYLNIYLTMLELLFESNSFDAANALISKIRQIVASRPDEFNRRQTHSSNRTGPGPSKKKHPLMNAHADKSSTLPKVSAIVSTYNSSRFMRGCLEDLVNQTLYEKGRLEIVVVDSGSEQNEKSIVGEFQRNYNNIRYIRTEEREFVYTAWNRAIKAASGEYITNANTDDRHRKDALEVMAGVLDQNPDVGLVYADAIITETENETFERHTRAGYFRWMDYDRVSLTLGCFIGPQPMWRKSLHEKYGYFDETFSTSGDWEFWLRIAKDTKLLHINEGLGLYLRSTGSLERRNVSRRLEEDRTVYRRYVPEYLPDYEEYFGRLLENDPPNRLDVYRYGQILAAFRRFDEAVSIYNSYLQKNPGDKEFIPILNDIRSQTSPSQIPADVAQPRTVRSGVQKRDIRVSAIVSAYNSEKFIRGCLEDLVNQTLYQKGELEIIVIDSGSQQNEEAVVKEFQSAYPDISCIKTEYRETIYTAWNRGIKEAKGMYITNANTDDRHRRDALEIMAGLLDENPLVALVYGDLIITKRENETFEQCSPAAYFQLPDFDRKILLHRQCIGPQPMWRRSLHDEFGYFNGDLEIAGDYEWWLRISEKYQLKHIPELLGLYLWNDAGLEHSGKELCQKESAGIRKFYMERAGMKPAFECYSSDFVVKHYQPPRSSSPSAPLPEKVMALINQADAHIANNDLTSARKAIKQAMRHASGHAQLCAMLSNILANLGDPESAGRFTEESEKK